MNVAGDSVAEMIDFVTESGLGAIGTPDDCAAQIARLQAQSNGGFGAFLMLAHDWANPQATHRSYELIANEVMPAFQGQAQATRNAQDRARALRPVLVEQQRQALDVMSARHAAEVAARRQG
jgi:limonene 1,2-monooxygenase